MAAISGSRDVASRRRTLRLEVLEPRILLSTVRVNSYEDNLDAGDGAVTLREAVIAANTDGTTDLGDTGFGADEIVFTSDLENQTILLSFTDGGVQQDIDITSEMTITGLGAGLLTIDGAGASRIFYIDDGDLGQNLQVEISGLTLTGGQAHYMLDVPHSHHGGAVYNAEDLLLSECVLSASYAQAAGGAIYNDHGPVTVQHSTISGNTAGYSGGGIYSVAGTLNVQDSTVADNTITTMDAGYGGGGIYNSWGTLTVQNSTISGNTATWAMGGGTWVHGGTLMVDNSTFAENDAAYGAGIAVTSSAAVVTLQNSTVSQNTAMYGGGGGIYSSSGTVEVDSSTILGNEGGGILNYVAAVTVTNSILSGNTASSGGAIYGGESGGTVTVQESTISGNVATSGDGGGIATGGAAVTLLNSIVAGNRASLAGGDLYDLEGSISPGYSLIQDAEGHAVQDGVDGNMVGVDPLFVRNPSPGPDGNWDGTDDDYGDLQPGAGSPAIDTGSDALLPTEPLLFDLDGNPRVYGLAVDMGAYEVQNRAPVLTVDQPVVTVDEGQEAGTSGTFSDDNAGDVVTLTVSVGTITKDEATGTWSWSYATTDGEDESQEVTITATDPVGAWTSTILDLAVSNVAPTVEANQALLTVIEGETAVNEGSFGDAGADGVSLAASLGTVLDDGDGTWSWSFATGGAEHIAHEVTITATDTDGASTNAVFHLRVLPTAYVVSTLVDESDDGDYRSGDLSLREAVELANLMPGADEITFDSALADIPIVLAGQDIDITSELTITGLGAGLLTIDGANSSRIFYIDDGDLGQNLQVEISGLTLTGGQADDGGAIFSAEALTVLDCVVTSNNATRRGGGIYNRYRTVTLENSTISENTARSHGGGIYNDYYGTLTVEGSTISGNTVTYNYGGGIYNQDGATLLLQESAVSYNAAPAGGGIYNSTWCSTATVQSSTFEHNEASVGGAVYSNGVLTVERSELLRNDATDQGGAIYSGGDLTITESLLSGNTAANYGGAIYGGGTVQNSTLSGNTATWGGAIYGGGTVQNSTLSLNGASEGGGIYTWSGTDGIPLVTLHNSIIGGNTATILGGDLYVLDGSVSATYSLIQDPVGHSVQDGEDGNIVGEDPGLDGLAENGGPTMTHALPDGSPAVGAGDPSFAGPPFTDQRGEGYARQVGTIDMGAYEVQNRAPVLTVDQALVTVDEGQEAGASGSFSDLDVGDVVNLSASVGTITKDEATGTWTWSYTPPDGPDDSQEVTIIATDMAGASVSGIFQLAVANVAPLLAMDQPAVSVLEGETAVNTGSFGDSGADAVSLTASLGTVIDEADGTWSWSASTSGMPDVPQEVTITATDSDAALTAVFFQLWVVPTGYVYVVDTELDESDGDYMSGDLSLREAVMLANTHPDANEITFDAGLADIPIVLAGQDIDITSEMTITGLGAGLLTIDGANSSRIFYIDDGDSDHQLQVSIAGLKLTAGRAVWAANVPNSFRGGAVYSEEDLFLSECALTASNATQGGAIYSWQGTVTLQNSTMSGNTASTQYGGGIYNLGGTLAVHESTVADNAAWRGGGIYNNWGTVTVQNSTIAGNTAGEEGGGIYHDWGTLTVQNSIVGGNGAAVAGADLYALGGSVSTTYSLIQDTAGHSIQDGVGGNIVGEDPKLGPLAYNGGPTQTHALQDSSPAFDAGDPAFAGPPEFDQRGEGYDRVENDRIDIGAYEIQILPEGPIPNHAPVGNAGGPYTISEGDSIVLDGSASFDPDADSLSYSWDLLNDGSVDSTDANPTFTWTQLNAIGISDGALGGSTFAAALRVDDGQGGTDTSWTTLVVANSAPVASASDPALENGGTTLSIDLDPADPSPVDQAGDFVYTVWWDYVNESNPGTPTGYSGPAGLRVSHDYGVEGPFTVAYTATDKDGGASGICFIVVDTDGSSAIDASSGSVAVSWCPAGGSYTAIAHLPEDMDGLLVFGMGGDDTISVEAEVAVPAVLDGGAGNDSLQGGGGSTSLVGGDGDDTLTGGSGDAVLDGGNGNDTLTGGSGQSVLQGGAGNDTLTGGSGETVLDGGSGDDVLVGGSGDVTVVPGDGSDTYEPGEGGTQVFVSPNSATALCVTEDGRLDVTLLASGMTAGQGGLLFTVDTLPKAGILLDADGNPVIAGQPFSGPPALTYQPGAVTEGLRADSFVVTVSDPNDSSCNYSGSVAINVVKAVADGQVTVDADGVVRIGGTAGDDDIEVTHDSTGQLLRVSINGVMVSESIALADIAELRGWSREGNDTLRIVDLSINSMLHGGAGDDSLEGAQGDDLLFGGLGNDNLIGASGNDFLVGGAGSDRLVGSAGHDVLVAGEVASTLTQSTLRQVLVDWASAYEPDYGADDDVLDESLVTDDDYDKLTGSSGHDWFIINYGDKITDFNAKKNLDGDLVTVV